MDAVMKHRQNAVAHFGAITAMPTCRAHDSQDSRCRVHLHPTAEGRRAQLLPFFAKTGPCLVGIEACGTSHHWARQLTAFGHEVRLMPPAYVKPYVKRGKNDAVDAEAICDTSSPTSPWLR